MVKLSSMGYASFPRSGRGYVPEKLMCIMQRAKIEDEALSEIIRYGRKRDLMKILTKLAVPSKPSEG